MGLAITGARFQSQVELDSRQNLVKTSKVSSWVLAWTLQVSACSSYLRASKWYNEAVLCGKMDFFNLNISNSLKKWKLLVTSLLSPNNCHNFSFGTYWSFAHYRVSHVSHFIFTCQLKCHLPQKTSQVSLELNKITFLHAPIALFTFSTMAHILMYCNCPFIDNIYTTSYILRGVLICVLFSASFLEPSIVLAYSRYSIGICWINE